MNTQRQSAINTSPYEVVFGQAACAGVFPGCTEMEIDEDDVMKVLKGTCSVGCCSEGWTARWMDGWMDGQTDGLLY